MAKRFCLSLLLLLMLLFQIVGVGFAAAREYYYDGAWHPYEGNEFSLKVNGKTLKTSMPPIVFDGYSVVPAREVFEHLGATVDWDGDLAMVTVTYDEKEIDLKINSKKAKIDGETILMPIEPKIINEKTMIPVRFVAEEIGLLVDFDSATDTILIDSEEKENIQITSVTWEKNKKNTKGFVTVETNADKVEYSSFVMENPFRIVIDVADAVNKSGKDSITVSGYNVEKIRIGQHAEATRFVVDLAEASAYSIEADGGSVIITVSLSEMEATESAEPDASAKPAIKPMHPGADAEEEPTAEPSEEPSSSPTASADPSTSPSPAPTMPPLSRYVTIDAGHGGTDPGAVYTDENGEVTAKEKDINLAVALLVQEKLEAEDVKVHMIRETDTYVDFQKVGSIANSMGTCLFVSIHTNSTITPEAHGIETWGYLTGGSLYGGMTSKKLSENVLDELIEATGANDRGVKDGKGLAVIHTSMMPATLVELGFITNTEEREKMMSDEYREILAEAITQGILKSLEEMGL